MPRYPRRKLGRKLSAAFQTHNQLREEFEKLVSYRKETLDAMNEAADKLDGRHRRVNIAKLTGASASVLGSAGVAIGGVGLALVPFTAGMSALVAGVFGGATLAVGGTLAVAGTLTSAGSHVVEKVMETVDLAGVQDIIDRDREQCDRVQSLWSEFSEHCEKIIHTIEYVDLSEEPDLESLKTWVLGAVRVAGSAISVILDTLDAAYKEIQKMFPKGQTNNDEVDALLMKALANTAKKIALEALQPQSLFSLIAKHFFVVGLGVCFGLIATIGVGNLFLLFTTSFNVHKGSLSKVAEDVRKKASQLKIEYDRWKNALDNSG